MRQANSLKAAPTESEKLQEVFRSAVVDKEVNNLKERQAKVRHLERILAGKTLRRQ